MKNIEKGSTSRKGGVMVGLNGNVSVQTTPSTKGAMVGLNANVSVQTNPGGWAGGRGNTAPDWAYPSNKKA